MNIFKKIGAALLAAALTATMAISASASSSEQSDVHTVTLEKNDDGTGIYVMFISMVQRTAKRLSICPMESYHSRIMLYFNYLKK